MVVMATKTKRPRKRVKGRDLPASESALKKAHIALETPVEAKASDAGVTFSSADSMEKILAEDNTGLSGEEFIGLLRRITAVSRASRGE